MSTSGFDGTTETRKREARNNGSMELRIYGSRMAVELRIYGLTEPSLDPDIRKPLNSPQSLWNRLNKDKQFERLQ